MIQFNSKVEGNNKNNEKLDLKKENNIFNYNNENSYNNNINIDEKINEEKIEKYDSSEQMDKKDNALEHLDSFNEFRMGSFKIKEIPNSSNFININKEKEKDNKNENNKFLNLTEKSINYNLINNKINNNNKNYIEHEIKSNNNNVFLYENKQINNKNYIKFVKIPNNKEKEIKYQKKYLNENSDSDGKENVTDDEDDNNELEYLKNNKKQNFEEDFKINNNINNNNEILNEDNNNIPNNNDSIKIKNISIKLLKDYIEKENENSEKNSELNKNNINKEYNCKSEDKYNSSNNEFIDKNNNQILTQSKPSIKNYEFSSEFISPYNKSNNDNNIFSSNDKNSLINLFDNNKNNDIYNESERTYSKNYINKINMNKIKKKLYSPNNKIKQNKIPIKTTNNFNNAKSDKLSKNYSFTPNIIINKKNKNKNKNIINKNHKNSNNIIDEEINKKVNIIIKKYSIEEHLTIVNIIQILYDLKIINELLKKNQNINLDIEKLKLNIEEIKENNTKNIEEELEFIEQLWFKINPTMNEYINNTLFLELLKLLFSYNNTHINNNKIKELVILIENLLYKNNININNNNNYIQKYISPLRNKNYEINDLWPIHKIIKTFLKLKGIIKSSKNVHENKKERLYNNFNENDKNISEDMHSSDTALKLNIENNYDESLSLSKRNKLPVYQRLYNLRKIKKENSPKINTKDEEFNFKPNYISNDKIMNKSFTNYNKERMPKGYYDYIIRNRALINKKESDKRLSEDKIYGKNYEKIKKMEIKPFNITDLKDNKINNKNNIIKKKNNKKIIDDIYITMEIKIPSGVKTFKIYKNNDNINEQINEFCEKYDINEDDKKKLFNKIIQYKNKFFGPKKI